MGTASHRFSLANLTPQNIYSGGNRKDVNVQNFPILSGMSLSLLDIDPKGVREPHWHPNANELGYCLEGRAIMTIFSPGFVHDTFIIEPGTLSFVPMGYLHHIENIGESPCRLLICFNHEQAEDINLSSAINSMSNHVLGATFKLDQSFFGDLKKEPNPVFISQEEQVTKAQIMWTTNRYKFNLEEIHPQVQTPGGWVKMSNSFLFPSLEGLSIFSLSLDKNGIREPHWHPNAHELNYLISGKARITLLSADGSLDTFEMNAGDLSFLPRGYFHHIENIGEEPARFAVFFNHSRPSDIGLSGSLGAYSNEILASIFKVPVSYFDQLPKYQEDLFVVAGGG